LIKQLKLVKKVKVEEDRNQTTEVKIGDKYTLKNNTSGYFTAADAKASKDARTTVLAGDYWIYNIANGMINITKSKGYPGSWINPATSTGSSSTPEAMLPQTATIGGKYILEKSMPGFYTAADAKENRNQRVTVSAGEYIIFNIANGMINVTKTKGSPGSWINPETITVATNKIPEIGSKYTLKNHTPGYYTAADAKAKKNQLVTVLAGEYLVFNTSNGMINLTKAKGSPGSWINPY